MEKKVAILGAGNLATLLSLELHRKGVEIVQVFSRTETSASLLANMLECCYVTKPEEITPDATIYLISVSDMAIEDVLSKMDCNNKLVAHTAGSIPMNILSKFSENHGVFYPLQTFSKSRNVNFSCIPFCIEANTAENEQILVELASLISNDVRIITSEQRKQLHLAAVFANNFVNHMYAIADEIIQQKDLPFDILYPLISETAAKIENITPHAAQTGPAKRSDMAVMQDHLSMLNDKPNLKKLYSSISDSISEYHKLPK